MREYAGSQVCPLQGLSCELRLDEVYLKVPFPEPANAPA